MGNGLLISLSTKQKVNSQNSTESEIITWDDSIPYVLWLWLLVEAKGWSVKDNLFKQDNQAAKRETNKRKASNSKRIKHIEIQYFFFITDLIKCNLLKVVYFPKEKM